MAPKAIREKISVKKMMTAAKEIQIHRRTLRLAMALNGVVFFFCAERVFEVSVIII